MESPFYFTFQLLLHASKAKIWGRENLHFQAKTFFYKITLPPHLVQLPFKILIPDGISALQSQVSQNNRSQGTVLQGHRPLATEAGNDETTTNHITSLTIHPCQTHQ